MTYSRDFRDKVFNIKEQEDLSFTQVAKRFGIARDTVFRWSKNIIAKTKRIKPSTKIDMEVLKGDIELYPEAYQYERAARLKVSKAGIWYALKRLHITYKKNSTASQSRSRKESFLLQNDPKVSSRRSPSCTA